MLFSLIFCVMFTLSSQAMTEPESSEAPSQPQSSTPMVIDTEEVVYDEKACFICREALEDKSFEFVCTTYNQKFTIHEFGLRKWIVEKKKFLCPFCTKHDIPVPYRNDDTNWDPEPEELLGKYATLLPVLGLGVIIQMFLSR